METDANVNVTVAVIGLGSEMTTHYSAVSLKATTEMRQREFGAQIGKTVLNPHRRNAKGIGNLTSQQAKRRHRSASSSSPFDESQRSSGLVVSREKTTQSLSRSVRPRHHHRPRPFWRESSRDLTPDAGEGHPLTFCKAPAKVKRGHCRIQMIPTSMLTMAKKNLKIKSFKNIDISSITKL
jgi:hypothetical protein